MFWLKNKRKICYAHLTKVLYLQLIHERTCYKRTPNDFKISFSLKYHQNIQPFINGLVFPLLGLKSNVVLNLQLFGKENVYENKVC